MDVPMTRMSANGHIVTGTQNTSRPLKGIPMQLVEGNRHPKTLGKHSYKLSIDPKQR
jgi:hypothetical protein